MLSLRVAAGLSSVRIPISYVTHCCFSPTGCSDVEWFWHCGQCSWEAGQAVPATDLWYHLVAYEQQVGQGATAGRRPHFSHCSCHENVPGGEQSFASELLYFSCNVVQQEDPKAYSGSSLSIEAVSRGGGVYYAIVLGLLHWAWIPRSNVTTLSTL